MATSLPSDGFDASASAGAAEYPQGGLLTGTVGYGKKLWQSGDPANPADIWKYGYARSALEWKTAAVTNRLTGIVQLYPISILGLSAGGGIDFRNYDQFKGIDCSKFICDQSLSFQFTQAQLIAGAGKFVGAVTGRYDWYHAQSAGRPFYDYMSYLTGEAGHDDLRSLTLLTMYRQSDVWGFGALALYQEMLASESNNGAVYAFIHYSEFPWQASLGIGDYRSDRQVLRPSAFLLITYTAKKSLALLP